MRTAFSTAKSAPSQVSAEIVPVAASGPLPAGLGVTRADLAGVGFEAKAGQTHAMPSTGRGKPVR
ncbi:MAG: hypothetical protein ACKOQ1_04965, partial [Actinomycetota bacterium]